MSKVLNRQSLTATAAAMMTTKNSAASTSSPSPSNNKTRSLIAKGGGDADMNSIEFDDFNSTGSILEFLSKEQECCSEEDADSIFQEINRLADNSDTRSVDEILREAELLIQNQPIFNSEVCVIKTQPTPKNESTPKEILTHSVELKNSTIEVNSSKYMKQSSCSKNRSDGTVVTSCHKSLHKLKVVEVSRLNAQQNSLTAETEIPQIPPTETAVRNDNFFDAFADNLPTESALSESVLSEESSPQDLLTYTATEKHSHLDYDSDEGTDNMEEITEGIASIELLVKDGSYYTSPAAASNDSDNQQQTATSALAQQNSYGVLKCSVFKAPSLFEQLATPQRRPALSLNGTQGRSPVEMRGNSVTRSDSMQTPDSGICSQTQSTQTPRNDATAAAAANMPNALPNNVPQSLYINKSVNTSPKLLRNSATSPIEAISAITREHALKLDIDSLQEKLKDTEERLQSLRIQHDSLSHLHRDLRESNTRLQEESEVLKLDVQHLNECANVLRSELQSSRRDRDEALELQKVLQTELEESRQDKKREQELHEKDTKTIQDLQRQCREMERILMRKHPDSVSALIVASKNPGILLSNEQENINSRKLLEQRIAQLEADAKEQDKKAQQILANVQARFNSVQSKYETHIADLEMQVLSLQDINTKLNEKIESQVRTLNYFVAKKAEKYYNSCTQTDSIVNFIDRSSNCCNAMGNTATIACNNSHGNIATQTTKVSTRNHSTNTIACAPTTNNSASSSTSSTANSTPNNSRPNSKQSGLRKPPLNPVGTFSASLASKLPVSRSDSTISLSSYAKEDAHLLATVRGMRIDLALKDKAMQRLSKELDECKKTIRKLQKDAAKMEKTSTNSTSLRRNYDASANQDLKPANTDNQVLKEAQNKIKLLEADYKSLHDKRLQDLKILQSAHERELSSCHETVRVLQQRLNERDEAFAMQKRRKMPVDYYALKAKVSSLERRHSEREERLHLLVEALSKGRFNGALEGFLGDKNNA